MDDTTTTYEPLTDTTLADLQAHALGVCDPTCAWCGLEAVEELWVDLGGEG